MAHFVRCMWRVNNPPLPLPLYKYISPSQHLGLLNAAGSGSIITTAVSAAGIAAAIAIGTNFETAATNITGAGRRSTRRAGRRWRRLRRRGQR